MRYESLFVHLNFVECYKIVKVFLCQSSERLSVQSEGQLAQLEQKVLATLSLHVCLF